ncbi:hypothetical protein GCM10022381_23820 [Leifsonia kafniensis]|uniref:DUF2804 domain-containing protein n=1 Tax=Leifsonia kafniensis TaxID=475957 RepID=A0ABP7KKZ5_9MICO
MSRTIVEREITAPVALCLPNGRLNPAAVGWSRRPLHDTSGINGRTNWGRNKRWEYWAVTSPTHIVSLTVSSLDYAAVHGIMIHDRRSGVTVERGAVAPLGRSATLPATLGAASAPRSSATLPATPSAASTLRSSATFPATLGAASAPRSSATLPARMGVASARARTRALSIDIDEVAGGTRLRGHAPGVTFDITAVRPAEHEALAVVVPWSSTRFQYTVKDVARPAEGWLEVNGDRVQLPTGESWAVLDHGRGRWPYRMTWNWGAASGVVDGRTIGLQLGGRWTDGTGSTENALLVDGSLHKISEELDWRYDESDWLAPWRIRGESLKLQFDPFWDHASSTELLVFGSRGHQCFGHYSGWVDTDRGRIRIDNLLGWAEDVRNRW